MNRTLVVALALLSSAQGITNTSSDPDDTDTAEYTQLQQFQPFTQQLTRSHPLSPQQQTSILSDVQQHHNYQASPSQKNLYHANGFFPSGPSAQFAPSFAQQQNGYTAQARPNAHQQQYTQQQYSQQQNSQQQYSQQEPPYQQQFPYVQPSFQRPSHQQRLPQQTAIFKQQSSTKPQQQSHGGDTSSFARRPEQTPVTSGQQPQYIKPHYGQPSYVQPAAPTTRHVAPPVSQTARYVVASRQQATTSAPTYRSQPTRNKSPNRERVNIVAQKLHAQKASQQRTEVKPQADTQLFLKTNRQKLYQQLIESQQEQDTVVPTLKATYPKKTTEQEQLQEEIDPQFQLQYLQKDDILRQLKQSIPGLTNTGQIATVSHLPFDVDNRTATTGSVFLANGQKLKVIQVPNKPLPGTKKITPQIKTVVVSQPRIPTTTGKPPKILFEELTKGVLPPGTDFEVIRHKQDGGLEEVGKLPANLPQKKVTFVILEEQPDGTVKVQGVRGNEGESGSESGDVDSIIKKLQEGDIKLPPSTKLSPSPRPSVVASYNTPQETVASPAYVKHSSTGDAPRYTITKQVTTPAPVQFIPTSRRPPQPTVANSHAGPVFATSVPISEQYYPSEYTSTTARTTTSSPFLPTLPAGFEDVPPSYVSNLPPSYPVHVAPSFASNSAAPYPVLYSNTNLDPAVRRAPTTTSTERPTTSTYRQPISKDYIFQSQYNSQVGIDNVAVPSSRPTALSSLGDILRREGLYAMAKFLKQSGLDTILNETGPYTLFVPTDQAFRTLLVQLGGPDKADEKFQENPRLLSGLLLHHVIPGAFRVDDLQDEMTGVSLAGTQLRVNTYTTQDVEWNDLKVVTINGARVDSDKQDVVVPQGVAHAVDRVMFPLPVGDLLQTLLSDREGRFTNFLRILHDSGAAPTLQGTKTFTLFAPTDLAFPTGELERLLSDKEAAKTFILRHVMPGTLFSAGMRYYQVRDSMQAGSHITLYKQSGRVKVNSAQVVTRNIPATNGVIHAIDALL